MKRKLLIFFLIFSVVIASGQEQKKNILVIPLSNENIHINKRVARILINNQVPHDSLVQHIALTAKEEIKNTFYNYILHFPDDYPSQLLPDSLYSLKKINCFYFDDATGSYRNNYENSKFKDSYRNIYYSVELTDAGKQAVKNMLLNSRCNYILFISHFEIQTNASYFSLSCEIADSTLKKIYGHKNEWKGHLLYNLYYEVLKQYVKKSVCEMLVKTEEYLRKSE